MRHALLSVVAIAAVAPVGAQTARWLDTSGGSFNDPGAWSIGGVPGASHDLLFDLGGETPYTVLLDTGRIVNSLEFNGARPTLDLDGHTLLLADASDPLRLGMIQTGVDAHLTIANGTLQTSAEEIDFTTSGDFAPAITLDNASWITDAAFHIGGRESPAVGPGTQLTITIARAGSLEFGSASASAFSTMIRDSSIVVDGAGSSLKVNGFLSGIDGGGISGALLVQGGGYASAATLRLGSIGISGAGSTLDVDLIAASSSGFVEDGGSLHATTMRIATLLGDQLPFPPGSWQVRDSGSTVQANHVYFDFGGLTVSDGGVVSTSTVEAELASIGMSSLVVQGEGSRFESSSGFFARNLNIVLSDGGVLSAPTVSLAPGRFYSSEGWRTTTLRGNGTIEGDVNIYANVIIEPTNGPLTITGDVSMFGTDEDDPIEGFIEPVVRVSLGAIDPAEAFLSIGGDALVDGVLLFTFDSGFTPQGGDTFVILEAQSVTGEFRSFEGPALADPTAYWSVEYHDTSVILRAVPTPGVAVLLLAGVSAAARRRRT